MPLRLALFLPLVLCACAAGSDAEFPRLVPVETLLIEEPLSPSPAPELEARAAALRTRADALRRTTP